MVAVAALIVLSACGSPDTTAPSTSSTSTSVPATASARLDAARCREEPSRGRIDRAGHDLEFRSGTLYVAMSGTVQTADGPDRTASARDADVACYGFSRWGNPDPEVPPDSLLFVFKGPGTDGAQVEFLVGDLTGGVLPPIGDVRPKVGPLTGPINAAVGISVAGTYYHSPTCALSIRSMSAQRASATFTCPTAPRSDADPFAPDDDVSYDVDESTPSSGSPSPAVGSAPSATASAPSAVTLSGWFELSP